MEKVSLLSYILMGAIFLLSFSANLSTKQVRRQQLSIGAFVAALFFLGISVLYHSQASFFKSWIISYNLFLGVGLILPQLISRIFVRQKISHPVFFLKKTKIPLLPILVVVMSLAFMAWTALEPREYSFTIGGPVFDDFYVLSSFSFLLFFIPLIIFLIQMLVERTAICESGFYQGGLLSDWSNFKSYSWAQGEIYADPDVQPFLNKETLVELTIEPKRKFFGTRVQLIIPFDEKNIVDNLLSRKINMEQSTAQQSHTRETTA